MNTIGENGAAVVSWLLTVHVWRLPVGPNTTVPAGTLPGKVPPGRLSWRAISAPNASGAATSPTTASTIVAPSSTRPRRPNGGAAEAAGGKFAGMASGSVGGGAAETGGPTRRR